MLNDAKWGLGKGKTEREVYIESTGQFLCFLFSDPQLMGDWKFLDIEVPIKQDESWSFKSFN